MKISIVDHFFKIRDIHLYISSYIREEMFLPSILNILSVL